MEPEQYAVKHDNITLKDAMLMEVEEMENLAKHILETLLNKDKKTKSDETLSTLVKIFSEKAEALRKMTHLIVPYQSRQKLITDLQECVNERDEVMEQLMTTLKTAEVALTSAIFQGNEKLKITRISEMRPVDSEEVVKFAHQISRGYSVSAPLSWQQGDPLRPFPTENEFRLSALAAPRAAPPQPNLNLLRQNANPAQIRTPQSLSLSAHAARMSSPIVKQQPWPPGQGTPPGPGRMPPGYTTGNGGRGGGAVGSRSAPFSSSRSSESSPRLTSPTVNVTGTVPPRAQPAVQNVEQMSSDSSSSSSSDEDSPK